MTLADKQTGTRDPPHDGGNAPARDLAGKRVLIVEDDPYIAVALEDLLAEQGLVIAGVARNLTSALRLAVQAEIDVALLDVNLGAEKIDPVAQILRDLGRPFVFTTGCGRAGLPEEFADAPIVEKPFYIEEIIQALRAVAASAPPR